MGHRALISDKRAHKYNKLALINRLVILHYIYSIVDKRRHANDVDVVGVRYSVEKTERVLQYEKKTNEKQEWFLFYSMKRRKNTHTHTRNQKIRSYKPKPAHAAEAIKKIIGIACAMHTPTTEISECARANQSLNPNESQ